MVKKRLPNIPLSESFFQKFSVEKLKKKQVQEAKGVLPKVKLEKTKESLLLL